MTITTFKDLICEYYNKQKGKLNGYLTKNSYKESTIQKEYEGFIISKGIKIKRAPESKDELFERARKLDFEIGEDEEKILIEIKLNYKKGEGRHASDKTWGYEEAIGQTLVYRYAGDMETPIVVIMFDEIISDPILNEENYKDVFGFLLSQKIYFVRFYLKDGVIEIECNVGEGNHF